MPKIFLIMIKVLSIFAGGLLLFALGFIGYLMITEFSPPKHLTPVVGGKGSMLDPSRRVFTFLTWNIGYAGLGSETDFFYDGGKMVIPEEAACNRYFAGIKNFVQANDTIDFIFLQEIDSYAKRSWYTDEVADLATLLPDHSSVYAKNYDCRFVPMPVQKPMGRVVSGLASYSRYIPGKAVGQYYDAYFPWPTRLAFLKRCFVMLRFELDNGKDLVIINTHNSAFDSTGALRRRELEILDSTMMTEYQSGNYVVAGGDWNSNPRGFSVSSIVSGDRVTSIDPPVESGFLPGWQFVFDPLVPSNRFADIPYRKGVTRTTIVDFFVLSPNIEVNKVATISAGFAWSDHQPVVMQVKLN